MAKLEETQKSCDKKKYLESMKEKRDMSGAMDYCIECKHSTMEYTCDIEHKQRVQDRACARAYNKLHRKKS